MAAIPDRERRWYFTRDVLLNSPSRKCQIEPEKELSYRQQAANLIQDMGQRLQVNQLCINTAIVYMNRFYVFHSFSRFPRNSIAAAALFLAAKVEEQPHKLEYVIKVHHACLHRGSPVLDTNSDAYLQQAQELVINESILLQTLGFEVAVDHPHTHVVKCTQMIRGRFKNAFGSPSKDLAQTSYFMATNSLHLTTFCLQYRPTVVACVCIYLVAKWSQWEIMKSSDGKDWWEYVDPTVTKELLDELTKEFLRIFDACPSRLKRRISNEKITSQSRKRPKEGSSDFHSASTAKSIPSSSASVSSVDSGLPGSGNSESSVNTQELTATTSGHGESFSSSQDSSHTEGEKLGLHEINMGLPMVESSMFSLDSEYMSGISFNPGAETKHGPSGTHSDSDQGKPLDQQGHPVKKSLKEYREQKERERIKTAQQSRETAPPRPSHTASRPGAMSTQNTHTLKGNVEASHTDQRHREGNYTQGGQKNRLEDRRLPVDHRKAEKPSGVRQEQPGSHPQSKSSGRPTDLRPTKDQRPYSQHRPNDSGSQPSHGASGTDSRYSKGTDQHQKHSRESVPNSSDRKQQLGPGLQAKEHKRNGIESKELGANLKVPETNQRLLSSAPPNKPHATASQKPHTETLNAHSSEKILTSESQEKPHPETPRLSKSEMCRSNRPEHQGNLKSEKHRTPSSETIRPQKSQSLKPQRSEIPKGTSTEKERTQHAIPPLVSAVDAKREQRSAPAVETQRAEPPQPIDQELPKPQRPERVLLQQPETLKVDRRVTLTPNKHDSVKVQKTEDMLLHKSDTVTLSRTVVASVKSTGISKAKAPEPTKSLKSDGLSKPHKTEESRLPRAETHNTQRLEIPKPQTTDIARSKESQVPQTRKPQLQKAVKAESQLPGTVQTKIEKSDVSKTQKVLQSQPRRPETPKKQRIKQEQGQPQKPATPKSRPPQATPEKLLEKDSGLTSTKVLANKSQKLQTAVVQNISIKSEVPDASLPTKSATRKKPLTPPTSNQEALAPEKPGNVLSQKHVGNKSKQPEMSTSVNQDKAVSQKSETVTPEKTDPQVKPLTPTPQRATATRPRASPAAASEQVPKPSRKVETSKLPKVDKGGTSVSKVVWEPAKPLELIKPAVSDEVGDSESVDEDIDKLINAHMAEQSNKQGLEVPTILDLKPTVPLPNTSEPLPNTTESRERKRERDESNLPKSYRQKESHHRKKRSEGHRSRGSPHKHRHSSDHRKASRVVGQPSSAEKQANVSEGPEDIQPHSSILTTSSGIRLKIKGLSNSMNSGSGKHEPSPEPSRQTSSPGLVMKLNLSKMQPSQTNSDQQPESEAGSEKSSGHHRHHHRRHKHGHHKHHKSRRSLQGGDGQESNKRKRSQSRSDSVSSGGRDVSPAMSSPAKKRTHSRASHSHPKSILPSEQSLLSLPMPPEDPSSGYPVYESHTSTGQFSYGMSDFSHHAPLTTVTALPSSDGFGYYPYNQSSDGHLPPPPPPPREDQPPPPPPRV